MDNRDAYLFKSTRSPGFSGGIWPGILPLFTAPDERRKD
jgi:hypothetical protein